MPDFNSEESAFLMDDSGDTLRNISVHLQELSGLPGVGTLREVSGASDNVGTKWHRGPENIVITGRGIFSTTALTGSSVVMRSARLENGTRGIEYGPHGNGSGALKYTAEVKLSRYEELMRMGDLVRVEFSLQVEGGVTETTFA